MARHGSPSISTISSFDVLVALLSKFKRIYPGLRVKVSSFNLAVIETAGQAPQLFHGWTHVPIGKKPSDSHVFLIWLEPRVMLIHRGDNPDNTEIRIISLADDYRDFPDRRLLDNLWSKFESAMLRGAQAHEPLPAE